jgi:hypothetical protein
VARGTCVRHNAMDIPPSSSKIPSSTLQTNDAFATVNAGTLAYLEDPANVDVLTAVLTYHVTGVPYCVAEEICGNPISPGLLTPSVLPPFPSLPSSPCPRTLVAVSS